jgi:hypothetical protein
MPGILALGVHTSGVLIKLFSEGIENVQPEPVTALMATGAGPVKVIRFGVIPQITPFFVSMTLYRFESDVARRHPRFTGAGGIGVYLYDKLRSYENQDVTTILIVSSHRGARGPSERRDPQEVHLIMDERLIQDLEIREARRRICRRVMPLFGSSAWKRPSARCRGRGRFSRKCGATPIPPLLAASTGRSWAPSASHHGQLRAPRGPSGIVEDSSSARAGGAEASGRP